MRQLTIGHGARPATVVVSGAAVDLEVVVADDVVAGLELVDCRVSRLVSDVNARPAAVDVDRSRLSTTFVVHRFILACRPTQIVNH